jgi:hypothetical protein
MPRRPYAPTGRICRLPVNRCLCWTTRAVSGKKLWMHTAQRIQGCLVPAKEILWLRRWVDFHPHWSRKQLARELCLQWQWLDGRGRLKDFAARSFLLKLEGQGQIRLPALQANKRRVRRGVDALAHWEEPPVLGAGLQETQPLRLELVRGGSAEQRAWAFYWDRYHYLGLRVVGENIGYLVKDPRGRELACLLFGAAAWCCGPRDRALRWGRQERQERLREIANNTRFLILPWVKVPHLASHVLGQVARRIDRDWREKYGHDHGGGCGETARTPRLLGRIGPVGLSRTGGLGLGSLPSGGVRNWRRACAIGPPKSALTNGPPRGPFAGAAR